jgi:preprotein translocase subunit SecD
MHWELVAANRARVSLPLTTPSDHDLARMLIARPGILEFRLVHEQSTELLSEGQPVAGYEVLFETRRDASGSLRTEKLLVKTTAEGQGRLRLKRAMAMTNPISGTQDILFEFDEAGVREFAAVTESNIGRRLAIVVDGTLHSAPRINEPIPNGRAMITGELSQREAIAVVAALESQLPANVQVVEERGY